MQEEGSSTIAGRWLLTTEKLAEMTGFEPVKGF
jgi:hypothetical protein